MTNEEVNKDRLSQISDAGEHLAIAAEKVREDADRLRNEVQSLTKRLRELENDNVKVAEALVIEGKKVQVKQVEQDGRLTKLED